MLHFGSDEGVEMVATYHSLISTVKMQGRFVWEFLSKFFTNIFNGCRDYLNLSPKILDRTMAIVNKSLNLLTKQF